MKKCFATVLVICIILALVFSGCDKPTEQPSEFVPPKDYVTVVQVTINPTLNLYLDAQDSVSMDKNQYHTSSGKHQQNT